MLPWENQPHHWDLLGASLGVQGGLPLLPHGLPVPVALAADPLAGTWRVNGMVMLEGLGEIVPARGTPPHPLVRLGGQMGSPLPPPSPAALLRTAPAMHAAGCKRQLGGLQALIEQEA